MAAIGITRAVVRDGINILSKLTAGRAWNAAKVLASYYVARATSRPVHWGLPIRISFEPTTSCNLRCPECPSGLRSFTRPTGMLEADLFEKTIDELRDSLLYLILYFQGEPYLHPQFHRFVKYAHDRGLYTATSTNAHYLDDANARATIESGLDRLIISIDGTTQESYAAYRVGGRLEKVLEGTRNIVRWKRELKSRTPHLIFQFLVFSTNEHQIDDITQLGKDLGVDEVRLKTGQVYEFENGNPLIPAHDRYSRYAKQDDGRYHIKSKLLNHCWRLWEGTVLTWDGLVVPCCFDKDADHRFGSVHDAPFAEIWRNGEYRKFRAAVLRSRSAIDICTNCTEGTSVWT